MRPPLAALAAVSLTACGGVDEILPDASGARVETRRVVLAPADVVEAGVAAGPGESFRIQLTAGEPTISWDIHRHDGDEIIVVEQGTDVASLDHRFEPPARFDWAISIANGGDTDLAIDVRLELSGGRFLGWQ